MAQFDVQLLDGDNLPVPGAYVFFQVRGTAFREYVSVANFVAVTGDDGVASLRYGYRNPSGAVVGSEDVIVAWALSDAGIGSEGLPHVSARGQASDLAWLNAIGQTSFVGAMALPEPCNDLVNCDPIGLPYLDCAEPTCTPPDLCNVNCSVPPDTCVLVPTLCGLVVPEIINPIEPTGHLHKNYPRVPNGGAEIVEVFGKSCNPNTRLNQGEWHASDGAVWEFDYHRKLGGRAASVFHDIKYHVRQENLRKYVKSGIFAELCRPITGSTKMSTHAWGIAWDISASYEHYGHGDHNCHLVKRETGLPDQWELHGFFWGRNFSAPSRDCMHFQYATGY